MSILACDEVDAENMPKPPNTEATVNSGRNEFTEKTASCEISLFSETARQNYKRDGAQLATLDPHQCLCHCPWENPAISGRNK